MRLRDYLDGQGRAELPYDTRVVTDSDNSCFYLLDADGPTGEDRAGIDIKVYQPGYALPDLIDRELDWYHHPAPARDTPHGQVQVYEPDRPLGDYATPWLRYDDVYVQLTVDENPPQLPEAVIALVARRLPELVENPSGPQRFDYASPVFPTSYVNACDISTARDFRDLFGLEPSPSVAETLSPGVGVIKSDSGLLANLIPHSCRRHTPEAYLGSASLTIETDTFESTRAAIEHTAFRRQFDHGFDVPTPIGDEAFAGTHFEDDVIVFRVGKTVTSLHVFDSRSAITASNVHEALQPIAAAIAARIPRPA